MEASLVPFTSASAHEKVQSVPRPTKTFCMFLNYSGAVMKPLQLFGVILDETSRMHKNALHMTKVGHESNISREAAIEAPLVLEHHLRVKCW